MDGRIEAVIRTVEHHGYTVDRGRDVKTLDRAFGVLGRLKIVDPKYGDREKHLLYTEGTEHQKGLLTGMLEEPNVVNMTRDYVNRVIWAFFSKKEYTPTPFMDFLGMIITFIGYIFSLRMRKDTHPHYREEMKGILAGCRLANPKTGVRWWRIWVLNTGIDAILSVMYTGKLGLLRPLRWTRHHRPRVPFMCNAFAMFGDLTENGDLFFGRDFMFPTAGVFQLCAVQIVHRTEEGRVFTGITAPGMAGLMTGMNDKSLAMGVNMIAAGNCSPRRPGMNSLLMVRHCIDKEDTLEGAIDRIEKTRRGVSWIYSLVHGGSRTACIVEAGATRRRGRFTRRLPRDYRAFLPDDAYLAAHQTTPFRNGIMVRRPGYDVTKDYLRFNEGLITRHGELNPKYTYRYRSGDFGVDGFLDDSWFERNCPGAKYFPPQRFTDNNWIMATNYFVTPEMRLYQMEPLVDAISTDNDDDFQWRYDKLNQLIMKAGKRISFAKARDMIDFLDPKFGCENFRYYIIKSGRTEHIRVEGSVSLLDATALVMETLVGYYEDAWVRLDLKEFLD